MKATALLLSLALALTAVAGDDVIKAANEAKRARKKSRTPVITNEDVRKSKGTLVVREADAAPPVAAEEDPVARQQRLRRERKEIDARLTAAEETVATLEAKLRSIEQSYYDEPDPDRRDSVIASEFAAVSEKLKAAREELAAAEASLSAEASAGAAPAKRD